MSYNSEPAHILNNLIHDEITWVSATAHDSTNLSIKKFKDDMNAKLIEFLDITTQSRKQNSLNSPISTHTRTIRHFL